MGAVLDIYVEFIVRIIIRLFRAHGSKAWPVISAKVSGTNLRPGGFGCAVADVAYSYRSDGELYRGTDAVPFVWTRSAKNYLERYRAGDELLIRVKPGSPGVSVVRQKDLYLHGHGFRLEAR